MVARKKGPQFVCKPTRAHSKTQLVLGVLASVVLTLGPPSHTHTELGFELLALQTCTCS